MRALAGADRVWRFLRELARAADAATRVYLTGGATAVLLGWRASTIDIDVKLVPESDALLRAIARLKDELGVRVELAAPSDFIRELPGWEGRSPFVTQEGPLAVFHYDLYAQALAKIERGHTRDVADVREMLGRHLVEPTRLRELFEQIEPQLYRYPALHPAGIRTAVDLALADPGSSR
jgi:hypothetical protein